MVGAKPHSPDALLVLPDDQTAEHDVVLQCSCGHTSRIEILVSAELATPTDSSDGSSKARLLPIETTVLAHIAKGKTDKEIASHLGISINRVRNAVRNALLRLSASSRAEAVFVAVRSGIIPE